MAQRVKTSGGVALLCLAAVWSFGQKTRYADMVAADLTPSLLVDYKTAGQRPLKLHIFLPLGFSAEKRYTAFVVFHGGGWGGGAPRAVYPFARFMAAHGLVGISVEYRRLAPKDGVSVFDCVRDARSAIRYIRRNAAELGIDPRRVVVSGASAGGHLAAATLLLDHVDESGDDVRVSCLPDLLVLYYPVIDTSEKGYGRKKIGNAWQDLSPAHHVRAGLAPTLILQGTEDRVTPYVCAVEFQQKMRAAGNICEMISNNGGAHGYFLHKEEEFNLALRQSLDFVRRYLPTCASALHTPGGVGDSSVSERE